MAKKQGRYEPIDEDMIRNLIGGVDAPPRLVPKQAPAAPPPETPPPEMQTESQITRSAQVIVRQSETNAGHNKGKDCGNEYKRIFLCPQNCLPDTSCRIKRSTREKLAWIVRMLGSDDMSVKAYVNNILDNHLEQYRDEINELIETTKNSSYDKKHMNKRMRRGLLRIAFSRDAKRSVRPIRGTRDAPASGCRWNTTSRNMLRNSCGRTT